MRLEEFFHRMRRKEIHLKVTATITVKIAPADLVVADQALPDGKVGVPMPPAEVIKIQGGQPPDTVSLVSDPSTVPPGLTLQDDGSLIGTPTSPGDFSFQVQVADSTPDPTAQVRR